MLRDEIAQYTELSGNDGLHTPIGIIGAYLDGYEKGKAKAERNEIIDPVDLVHDLAERIGIHQLYAIVVDMRGEPERKKGKWIEAEPRSGRLGWVCSCCDHEAYWDSDYGQQLFGWCPWCGAEMKGKGDAEID